MSESNNQPANRPSWHYILLWVIVLVSLALNIYLLAGFINFQHIEEGKVLAIDHGEVVKAPVSGNIFMPLYQNQGADGFFIIERTEEG